MRRSGCVTWMDLGTGNPSQLPFSPFLCFPCFLFIETSSGRELTPQLCPPPPPRPRILPLVYRPCLPLPIPSFLLFDAQSLPLSFFLPSRSRPRRQSLYAFSFLLSLCTMWSNYIGELLYSRGTLVTPSTFSLGSFPLWKKCRGGISFTYISTCVMN